MGLALPTPLASRNCPRSHARQALAAVATAILWCEAIQEAGINPFLIVDVDMSTFMYSMKEFEDLLVLVGRGHVGQAVTREKSNKLNTQNVKHDDQDHALRRRRRQPEGGGGGGR